MPWLAVLLLLLFLPFLLALLLLNLASVSFERLGLSADTAVLLVLGSLLGSVVNIPVWRRNVEAGPPRVDLAPGLFGPILYYRPPPVREQVIALNVGGAVIPIGLSAYLLATVAPLLSTLVVGAIVTVAAKLLSEPRPGVGVTLPALIPPVIAAGFALIVAPSNPAAAAYAGGVLGTLIGADVLNLPAVLRFPNAVLSIGGAGIFDGIFFTGILAVLLT
ncbi:MAG TPA: DUF1614 domain-containing protein [Dehalococcoidia bacterium]